MEATTPPNRTHISINRALHGIALEFAEPPLIDFDAFCVIVDECCDATGRAVRSEL